jgi:hypothetical protein
MQLTRTMTLAFAVATLAAACTSGPSPTKNLPTAPAVPKMAKDHLPSLESHLAAAWIGGATRLQAAGASAIYYHGTARRTSPEGEPWTGTIEGDVLFLSPEKAVLLPKGTLTVGAGNSIKTVGPNRTFLTPAGKDPQWIALIPM